MIELSVEEQDEINSQLLLIGQMVGMSWRINAPLLKRWIESKHVDSDFRYEDSVRETIKFTEALRKK